MHFLYQILSFYLYKLIKYSIVDLNLTNKYLILVTASLNIDSQFIFYKYDVLKELQNLSIKICIYYVKLTLYATSTCI